MGNLDAALPTEVITGLRPGVEEVLVATAGRGDNPVMLRAYAPDGDENIVAVDPHGPEAADAPWLWFDVEPADRDDVEALAVRLDLNRHAVEDSTLQTHYPKLDDYDDHLFIVVHGVTETAGRLDTIELDAFLGENFLVTVHPSASPAIDWTLENAATRASGPDVVLARLVEASTRRLLPLIDGLDLAIDELEEAAIVGDGDVVPEIQALRRDTTRLRRVVGPQRDVLASLAKPRSVLIGSRARLRFSSAFDHTNRVVENLDSARGLLSSILDTYRSTTAEKLNEVMKVLTVYAAILLPLSLIAGIYGMNFSNMPELGWRWGYFGLLGVMATVAMGQWIYFARRGFIGVFSFRRIPRTLGRGLARLALLPVDAVSAAVGMVQQKPGSEPPEQEPDHDRG